MIPELHLRGRVRYPGSVLLGLVSVPTEISIIERVNRHVLFRVRHEGRARYAKEILHSGAPMIVSLTAHKGTRRWFGYVDSVTEKVEDNVPHVEVIGVGVTYPMKEPVNYVLGELVTAERALIKGSGLVPIVRGPNVDKTVVAGGRSQWAVLLDAASQFNQYVFTSGTTVNVLRMHEIVETYLSESIPLAWMGTTGEYMSPWAFHSFDLVRTDNIVDRRVGYGVDPFTASVRQVDLGESMFGTYPGYVARGDVTERLSGDPIVARACAEGGGHTGVSAGKIVHVKNTDPGPWWFVERVEHRYVTKDAKYTISTDLMRTREIEKIPFKETHTPTVNTTRLGDNAERVNYENDPILTTWPTLVKGMTSWKDKARWRPRC